MNKRIDTIIGKALDQAVPYTWHHLNRVQVDDIMKKFAELIVLECANREELLGAIARGWCSEKNEHKTMDPDLALAIFDEVEKHIKEQIGVQE